MEYKAIVTKLIGSINPIGETNTDNQRFENLNTLCNLVDSLIMDIGDMAYIHKDSHEYSIKRAVDFANKFLSKTVSTLNPQ